MKTYNHLRELPKGQRFVLTALWLKLTTEDQRKAVLGYLIALAVVASIVSLLTGQGPNSAYGFNSSPVQYASQSVPSVC